MSAFLAKEMRVPFFEKILSHNAASVAQTPSMPAALAIAGSRVRASNASGRSDMGVPLAFMSQDGGAPLRRAIIRSGSGRTRATHLQFRSDRDLLIRRLGQ